MSLYDEYESYVKQYRAEYGPNTIVLYRCGSFYEIYAIEDGLVDIKSICELLNIQISRRNKSILQVDRSNCYMAGFPAWALKKFVNVLVDNLYTVVIVDQVSDPPKPKRAVTEVVSPGTKFDDVSSVNASLLMVAYFESHEAWRSSQKLTCVGVAMIDLTTGKSKVAEYASKPGDSNLALDELYKTLSFYSPKEIVLASSEPFDAQELIAYLELGAGASAVHDKLGNYPATMRKVAYQEQLFKKVYPKHGLLSVFEYLELERRPLAANAFALLLDFSYRHNENIIKDIALPEILFAEREQLLISYNTCKQLNITTGGASSLIAILNRCQTAIGRRAFKDRLLSPMVCPRKLEAAYSRVESFGPICDRVQKMLSGVYDVERLYRRLVLKRLHPAEFLQIDQTIEAALAISELVPFDGAALQGLRSLREAYSNALDMEEIAKYHLDNVTASFFAQGVHPHIDEMQSRLSKVRSAFDVLANNMHAEYCRVDSNERDGFYIAITAKRFADIRGSLKGRTIQVYEDRINMDDLSAKPLSSSSSTLKISGGAVMRRWNEELAELSQRLTREVLSAYQSFVECLAKSHGDLFPALADYVCDVDWHASCASAAREYRYARPKIADRFGGRSYVDARAARHPIIERISTCAEYVPNDVEVGTDASRAMLLYGINSAGKSSISKALGLITIMAQAGMYVPCAEFTYWPYREVFTRIPSGDDLMKGQSTFVVEVCELRSILRRATRNSLVIGDELASGTESVSALAIVGAGIQKLHEREASFVFATHLHDLCGLTRVRELPGLRVCHLSVRYDAQTEKLIYDRTLKEGQGSTLYGLEVCKSLSMGDDFLSLANEIRKEALEIAPELHATKTSRYNASVYVDTCGLCGGKAEEVHHIKQQSEADDDGFVGHVHKNAKSNLVAVCKACHDGIHAEKIKIDGYRQTSDGIELCVAPAPAPPASDRAALEESAREMRAAGAPVKQISQALGVSLYRIRKILSDQT